VDKFALVDENRAWLNVVEMLLQLAPEVKLIVCARELGKCTDRSKRSTSAPSCLTLSFT